MSELTRRKFIKATGAGLVASAAPLIFSRNGHAAPSETVNVAVVGVGGRGGGHAGNFASMKNSRLVAVCDVDSKKAEKVAKNESKEKGPVKAYTDFRRMLEDKSIGIDAVSIATCDHWHTPVALAALVAGKHVYVETP